MIPRGRRAGTILDEWEVTAEELTVVLRENPSLKGMVFGYVAELKLKEAIMRLDDVTYQTKFDDHDRKKKGDLFIIYRGAAFDIESKSLQTKTVRFDEKTGVWSGKAQVDASDRRPVTLEGGVQVETTLLKRDEFDVLAINCYAFTGKWDFVFCRNRDLPSTGYRKYVPAVRAQLIASTVSVSLPPRPPFVGELRRLLDDMIAAGEGRDPAEALGDGPTISEADERDGTASLPPLGGTAAAGGTVDED